MQQSNQSSFPFKSVSYTEILIYCPKEDLSLHRLCLFTLNQTCQHSAAPVCDFKWHAGVSELWCAPATVSVPPCQLLFTQTLVQLCDYLCCRFKGGTTITPIPCSYFSYWLPYGITVERSHLEQAVQNPLSFRYHYVEQHSKFMCEKLA